MKMMRSLLLLFSLLLSACVGPQVRPVLQPLTNVGSLTVYLQPLPQESHRLTFDIASIQAIREDGGEENLVEDFPPVRADQLIGLQKKLSTTRLEQGQYLGIALRFKGASLLAEEGEAALSVPVEPVIASQKFTIKKGQATTLFLTLLPERMLTDGFRLTPRFSLAKPQGLLISLKGFVSNSEINNLTIFDRKHNVAVDTLAMRGQPRGIALDQARALLYVALSGSNAVGIIEVNNAATVGMINLRVGDDPREIVLGRQGRTLISINPGSHSASIIDTLSLTEVDRLLFKSEPTEIFRSAVGARAFVLLPDTNSISLIDYSSPRRTEVLTVALDETPLRGIASKDGAALYLLTSFSSNLLVLDTETLTISNRIYIGSGAQALVEERNGLVYVAKRTGEIMIVDPSVRAVIDSFPVPKGARFLTLDESQNALFAVYPERGVVEKFGLTSKKSLGVMESGAGAYAAALMGER